MKLTSVLSFMVLAAHAVPTPEETVDVDAARSFAESFTGTLEAPAGIEVPDKSIEARAPRSCYFDCIIRQGWFCNGMCSGRTPLKNQMSCVTNCQSAGQPGCAKVCSK
ncbi:hypothetical protein NW755_006685 [Fusarium falciforme]|uniref:Uncharacterized protein n=1 Tax=Fusarium falciforme TaxID=195108 RepID=A0A9W8R5J2_9HYPO|nr:hypothetical protein NW755_006685 [Fusarium falciforme]KAJ4249363.1 hypothetical protein NW757_007942 [Fusarium falciforme]